MERSHLTGKDQHFRSSLPAVTTLEKRVLQHERVWVRCGARRDRPCVPVPRAMGRAAATGRGVFRLYVQSQIWRTGVSMSRRQSHLAFPFPLKQYGTSRERPAPVSKAKKAQIIDVVQHRHGPAIRAAPRASVWRGRHDDIPGCDADRVGPGFGKRHPAAPRARDASV
ncbi:hypothetical protein [Sorlinia euscelidii]